MVSLALLPLLVGAASCGDSEPAGQAPPPVEAAPPVNGIESVGLDLLLAAGKGIVSSVAGKAFTNLLFPDKAAIDYDRIAADFRDAARVANIDQTVYTAVAQALGRLEALNTIQAGLAANPVKSTDDERYKLAYADTKGDILGDLLLLQGEDDATWTSLTAEAKQTSLRAQGFSGYVTATGILLQQYALVLQMIPPDDAPTRDQVLAELRFAMVPRVEHIREVKEFLANAALRKRLSLISQCSPFGQAPRYLLGFPELLQYGPYGFEFVDSGHGSPEPIRYEELQLHPTSDSAQGLPSGGPAASPLAFQDCITNWPRYFYVKMARDFPDFGKYDALLGTWVEIAGDEMKGRVVVQSATLTARKLSYEPWDFARDSYSADVTVQVGNHCSYQASCEITPSVLAALGDPRPWSSGTGNGIVTYADAGPWVNHLESNRTLTATYRCTGGDPNAVKQASANMLSCP